MAAKLNKKQKKQIDVHRKKIESLRLKLAGAKEQMDDPEDVTRIEEQIVASQKKIEQIQAG